MCRNCIFSTALPITASSDACETNFLSSLKKGSTLSCQLRASPWADHRQQKGSAQTPGFPHHWAQDQNPTQESSQLAASRMEALPFRSKIFHQQVPNFQRCRALSSCGRLWSSSLACEVDDTTETWSCLLYVEWYSLVVKQNLQLTSITRSHSAKTQAMLLTTVLHQLHQNSQNYGQPIFARHHTKVSRLDVGLLGRLTVLWQSRYSDKRILWQMPNVCAHGNGVVDVLRDCHALCITADQLTWPQMRTFQIGQHSFLSDTKSEEPRDRSFNVRLTAQDSRQY